MTNEIRDTRPNHRISPQHAIGGLPNTTEGIILIRKDLRGVFGERPSGNNPSIEIAAEEDVWNNGGDYIFPAAAETLDIVSSDADDDGDGNGTGAQTVRITGLDADYKEITEDMPSCSRQFWRSPISCGRTTHLVRSWSCWRSPAC